MAVFFRPCTRIFSLRSACRNASLATVAAAAEKQGASLYQGVVGLEIHAQIASRSKLFSGSGTSFTAPTNSLVSLFDCGTPGTLPVLNRKCVEAAAKTALALNCSIHPVSSFDRKHYFYSDLPTGYQITQHFNPIATDGWMEFPIFAPGAGKPPKIVRLGIEQVQLEQDSGKSLHNADAGYSLIDLNRAGIGLMEIITRPELESGEQAAAFVRELLLILRTLGVCDVKMYEGSVRVDANISVRKPGEPLGVRSEVKNISSAKFVAKAVEYEIGRQIKLKELGEEVINETRGYDFNTGSTYSMRDKEILQDYRYMPEPNLPPLRLFDSDSGDRVPEDQVDLKQIRLSIPSLPSAKRKRFVEELGLTYAHAFLMVAEEGLSDFFENILSATSSPNSTPSKIANIIATVLLGILNDLDQTVISTKIRAEKLAKLMDFFHEETIPRVIFTKILKEMCKNSTELDDLEEYVRKNEMLQINDVEELEKLCDQVISHMPEKVQLYKDGKVRVINFLVNEVKIASNERANLKIVKEIMGKKLSGESSPQAG